MLNRVVLIGRLTQDPELRYTQSRTAVASFSLAVDRPRVHQNGEKETDFIQIVVWQKLAELCCEYLKRGRLVAVDGRLQIKTYENREGQKIRAAEVVAESVRFLERSDNNAGQSSNRSQPLSTTTDPDPDPDPFLDDPFADDGDASLQHESSL